MAIGSPQWMYSSGADAYELEQSLKFNNDDTGYLTRSFPSSGNRKTWTWSGWLKRGSDMGSHTVFFASYIDGSNRAYLSFDTSNRFYVYTPSGLEGYTTAVFRDPSAWYNLVIVCDTTQSTASNRFKVYVNGVQQSFTFVATPSQNADLSINLAGNHYVSSSNGTHEPYDGYLSEVNFIDGQALTPADFGETGTYGEWKPIEYSGTYGTNGFYLNFAGGGIMSATGGNSTVTDGDYKAVSFTSDGTFTPSANGYVEYLVIGGGGGGARGEGGSGGGGGAGGYRTGYLSVTGGAAYSVTVGAGGSASTNGSSSVFSSITSTGGGAGSVGLDGASGGSGGGAAGQAGKVGGSSSAYGNDGGDGVGSGNYGAGGGGGAGAAGANGTTTVGGNGGAGIASSITGSSVTRAGGGGGGTYNGGTSGTGGSGGGGNAGAAGTSNNAVAGTANTGSGGGGGSYQVPNWGAGGAGGSGIVIIRYKFQ